MKPRRDLRSEATSSRPTRLHPEEPRPRGDEGSIEFKSPKELFDEVEKEMSTVSKERLLNGAGKLSKDMLEKWPAAVFGLGYQRYIAPCKVKMMVDQNDSIDFILRVGTTEYPFQTTMRVKEGRYLGREYQERESNPILIVQYRPGEGSFKAPDWIYESVLNKTSRLYSNSKTLNLLVYANFETNGLDRNQITNILGKFKNCFSSIWVMSNHAIASIFVGNNLGEITEFNVIKELWPQVNH